MCRNIGEISDSYKRNMTNLSLVNLSVEKHMRAIGNHSIYEEMQLNHMCSYVKAVISSIQSRDHSLSLNRVKVKSR